MNCWTARKILAGEGEYDWGRTASLNSPFLTGCSHIILLPANVD
jgi:hypothetical protein